MLGVTDLLYSCAGRCKKNTHSHKLGDKSSVNQWRELRFPSGQKVKGRWRRRASRHLLSVIFPPHLPSVCFWSPSNSSLEAFSALLCSCLFLFATPSPLPPYTRNPLFKPPFLPVDTLSSELLLIFSPLSCLRLIYLYLPHPSLPLLFLFPSHFLFPALLLSSSIISLYSWSIFLSHEHFSLSLILFFLFTSTHPSLSGLPGIWSGVF